VARGEGVIGEEDGMKEVLLHIALSGLPRISYLGRLVIFRVWREGTKG
jgi:hypothetical protein